jgi:hypothetical protein
LLTGVLVESTILERNKFASKPIKSEIVEESVSFSDLSSASVSNVVVWRNDLYQNNTIGTLNRYVERSGIDTNPSDHTVVLNNNFGGNYIRDITNEQELMLCGTNDNGLFVTVIDMNEYSQPVPHYIWEVPYTLSIESLGTDYNVHSYVRSFKKIVATPVDSYPFPPGIPSKGCTTNYLNNRNNTISRDTVKILGQNPNMFGIFQRSRQTTDYTVDQCGDPDKSSPIVSTIVTNTSISTNNNGVLIVQ